MATIRYFLQVAFSGTSPETTIIDLVRTSPAREVHQRPGFGISIFAGYEPGQQRTECPFFTELGLLIAMVEVAETLQFQHRLDFFDADIIVDGITVGFFFVKDTSEGTGIDAPPGLGQNGSVATF